MGLRPGSSRGKDHGQVYTQGQRSGVTEGTMLQLRAEDESAWTDRTRS